MNFCKSVHIHVCLLTIEKVNMHADNNTGSLIIQNNSLTSVTNGLEKYLASITYEYFKRKLLWTRYELSTLEKSFLNEY